jgi:hypothetical protein
MLLALVLSASCMTAIGAEPDDRIGYELFHDGKRVGHEAGWSLEQAIDNFRWNVEHHVSKRVTAFWSGRSLPYLQAVRVLPIYYVPAGQKPPSESLRAAFTRHLKIAQARYAELLPQRITFALTDGPARIIHGREDLAWARKDYKAEAKSMTCEILRGLDVTQLTCPWVLAVMVMNSEDGFPAGGGRPLNGGLNRGGGVVFLSSHALDHSPNFQSTLQHELGHGFGLTHVNTYGRDMQKSPSLMSYNKAHHTRGFEPSATPGVLIPEDLRALAYNQLVFPGLRFVPARDVPNGYVLHPKVIVLNPMALACIGGPEKRDLPMDPGPSALDPPTSQIEVIRGNQRSTPKADGKVTPIDLKSLIDKAKKDKKTRKQ